MKMRDKRYSKIPVIKAFPRTDDVEGFMFWCPFCEDWHLHGGGEGHRVAHCFFRPNSNSPFIETGYILKPLTKREIAAFKRVLCKNSSET